VLTRELSRVREKSPSDAAKDSIAASQPTLRSLRPAAHDHANQIGAMSRIQDVEDTLKKMKRLYLNLPVESPVLMAELLCTEEKRETKALDMAVDNLTKTALDFGTSVQGWMDNFSIALSLSKEEITQIFADKEKNKSDVRTLFEACQSSNIENSFLKKIASELRGQLSQQEAVVERIREQSKTIVVLNETCLLCFEELDLVLAKESELEKLHQKHLEVVQDAEKKAHLIASLAKKRAELGAQLSELTEAIKEQNRRNCWDASQLHVAVLELRQIAKDVDDSVGDSAAEVKILRLQSAAQKVLEIIASLQGTFPGLYVRPWLYVRLIFARLPRRW